MNKKIGRRTAGIFVCFLLITTAMTTAIGISLSQRQPVSSLETASGDLTEMIGGSVERASPPTIVSARSCIYHGATEWCLELDTYNVEPRFLGVTMLEFNLSMPIPEDSIEDVSIESVNAGTYTGTATVIYVDDDTIRINLSEALPDQDASTITLSGSVEDSFCVRSLAGDVSRDGEVTVGDKALIKPKIGQPLTAVNFHFDVSCDGDISVGDKSLIKPKIGNSVPECP